MWLKSCKVLICYFSFKAQKSTISGGFNLISNSWQNLKWQPRWQPLLVTSQASSSAITHEIYLLLLKGHSQLLGRADLDTTFSSLQSVYINPKSIHASDTSRNTLQSCLLLHLILDLLMKTSFWANFYSSYCTLFYHIWLRTVFKGTWTEEVTKRVGAGRVKSPLFTKITREKNW